MPLICKFEVQSLTPQKLHKVGRGEGERENRREMEEERFRGLERWTTW